MIDELRYLKSKLQVDIDDYLNTLASGIPGSDPQAVAMSYKYTCGLIAGLSLAQQAITDLEKKVVDGE